MSLASRVGSRGSRDTKKDANRTVGGRCGKRGEKENRKEVAF